jgi:sulfite reductase alpha subunit-like flavoprotein
MSPPRTLLVLYGSETGTAADLAQDLARSAERLHFATTCLKANALDPPSSLPSYPIVIFVTSTTGQGDIPSNAQALWKSLLRKKLPGDWLKNTEFTTFGCGDSTYLKFNWAAKKVHKRFLQLGAREK